MFKFQKYNLRTGLNIPFRCAGGWMAMYLGIMAAGWMIPTLRIWVNARFLDETIGYLTRGQGLVRLGFFLVLLGLILLANILSSPLME